MKYLIRYHLLGSFNQCVLVDNKYELRNKLEGLYDQYGYDYSSFDVEVYEVLEFRDITKDWKMKLVKTENGIDFVFVNEKF